MTIKASGSISMSEINAEFALGTSLSSYRGATWYTDTYGASGTFPVVGGISMNAFYGKKKTSPAPPYTYVQYLLVGGGGGGASGTRDNIGGGGGGGGGGGYYFSDVNLNPGSYFSVTVGQGGAGGYWLAGSRGIYNMYDAFNGTASRISGNAGTVEAGGGFAGYGRYRFEAGYGNREPFGSEVYKGGNGGTGTNVGNTGGLYQQSGGSGNNAAGGGGGGTDDTDNVWKGGDGPTWFNGVTYSGGGGGGGDYSWGGAGGAGGGGHGGSGNDAVTQGTDGLGGGGGGGSSTGGYSAGFGARGGNGVVVIRYLGSQKGYGGTVISSGGYTYHYFYSDGTFTI